MAGILVPVPFYTGMSSWRAHINRGTPSTEPGTDFYVPIGTPVYAPASGEIWGSGLSIGPATGRWVGINFDNGMSFRCMHHSRLVRTSARVDQGEIIAYSGASGYGEEDWSWNVAETGGAHTHATLWPTHSHQYGYDWRGNPYTLDLMDWVGGFSGDGSSPFLPEDDMYSEDDRNRDNSTAAKVEELRTILYGAGLGDTAANSASTAAKVVEIRDILYKAGFGKLDQILTLLGGGIPAGGAPAAVDVKALAALLVPQLGSALADSVADEIAQRLVR